MTSIYSVKWYVMCYENFNLLLIYNYIKTLANNDMSFIKCEFELESTIMDMFGCDSKNQYMIFILIDEYNKK